MSSLQARLARSSKSQENQGSGPNNAVKGKTKTVQRIPDNDRHKSGAVGEVNQNISCAGTHLLAQKDLQ